MNIQQVHGRDLTDGEVQEVNVAIFREWKMKPFTKEKFEDTLFFFLKNDKVILALGGLKTVSNVYLGEEKFSILGVVEVIANIKGKGHGKMLVSALREYLIANNISGMGFTMPKNTPFYQKCGFNIEEHSTQRFVYTKDGERITNQDGQVIFYQDCGDKFMEKVLKNPDLEVSIPTDGLW